jgi:beta-lactamase regulating signal transducer with metallopeptidase domain
MTAYLHLAEAACGWLVAISLQVALLAAVALVLDFILKRRGWPELLAALWWVVFIRLLLPATLPSPLTLAPLQMPVAHLGPALPVETSLFMSGAVFALWAAGFVVCSTLAIHRYRSIRREILSGAGQTAPAWLEQSSRALAKKLGIIRPTMLIRDSIPGPALLGYLRPIIILPVALVQAGKREQLEHALLHELCHVRRHDPLASLIILVLQLVFWFHPCVWLARRRLAVWREVRCDQMVVEVLGGSASYRQTLLDLARSLVAPASGPLLDFLPRQSQLYLRLERLRNQQASRGVWRRLASPCLVTLIFLSCIPRTAPAALSTLPDSPNSDLEATAKTDSEENLQGCMRMRYKVLGLLAHENALTASSTNFTKDTP